MARKRHSHQDVSDEVQQVIHVLRQNRSLFDTEGNSVLADLLKIKERPKPAASKQAVNPDEKPHPFDMRMARAFLLANVHHARCVHAKVAATVGLGFYDDEVAEVLDPLCESSWQETQTEIEQDVAALGNGYLEVVREGTEPNSPIKGLYHLPAPDVRVVIENALYDKHYLHYAAGESGIPTLYAEFGDSANLLGSKTRMQLTQRGRSRTGSLDRIGEVIVFREPSNLSRWYGVADYLSAVTSIELRKSVTQYNYDFFQNHGVPEFLVFVTGAQVPKKEWDAFQRTLQGQVGARNQFKSGAVNFGGQNVNVNVVKMAMEGKSDPAVFSSLADTLGLEITSAHGVPPLLAGILIPSKLGATNELPNALMAFQTLVVGQKQRLRENTLANTLGDPKKNGGLKLRRQHFMGKFETDPVTGKKKKISGLRTILDDIDIGSMDTVARMRTPLAEAQAEGRDPADGLKE